MLKQGIAQSVVHVVDKLEEKGIQRYFVTITEAEGDETELMKKWASAPWYSKIFQGPKSTLQTPKTSQNITRIIVIPFEVHALS